MRKFILGLVAALLLTTTAAYAENETDSVEPAPQITTNALPDTWLGLIIVCYSHNMWTEDDKTIKFHLKLPPEQALSGSRCTPIASSRASAWAVTDPVHNSFPVYLSHDQCALNTEIVLMSSDSAHANLKQDHPGVPTPIVIALCKKLKPVQMIDVVRISPTKPTKPTE